MNALDKAIATVAPGWALQRARSRQGLAAYEAAVPSRIHKAKKSQGDANSVLQRGAVSIRGQVRHLEENSDLIDGLLTTLVNNVVGRDGIGVEPMPLDHNGQVHEAFARELLDGFTEWSLRMESTGDLGRAEAERLVCRTWLRDGECLGEQLLGNISGFVHPNGVLPFSLQLMEPDFLPMDLTCPADGVFQGIQLNDWQQAQLYHVYHQHPGSMMAVGMKTRSVLAERMLHIKQIKRLHSRRGISILASALQRIGGLQNYEESELVAARISAAMAFYIRKGEGSDYEDPETKLEKRRNLPISPGTIFDDLRPGEDVGTIESKRPSPMVQTFRDTMMRAVCGAAGGVNFSTVAKKYEGSYSAQRQELVDSYVSYGVLSNAFISQWARPVYRRYVQMSILTGRHVPPPEVDMRTVYLAYYQPPVMPWIDPHKEAQGNRELVRGGFGTESEVIRARGKNPQEMKRQRMREIRENRAFGLVYNSDSYHEYYGTRESDDEKKAADASDGNGGSSGDAGSADGAGN
ncbi:MAG: phage portal protein [Pontibacterium sp.]